MTKHQDIVDEILNEGSTGMVKMKKQDHSPYGSSESEDTPEEKDIGLVINSKTSGFNLSEKWDYAIALEIDTKVYREKDSINR